MQEWGNGGDKTREKEKSVEVAMMRRDMKRDGDQDLRRKREVQRKEIFGGEMANEKGLRKKRRRKKK